MKKILLGLLLTCGAASAAPAKPVVQTTIKTLSPVTADSLKKQIAMHKGKVVVVNFWATWCTPCVAELPSLAKWQKQYAAKGLFIMPVSADGVNDLGKAGQLLLAKGWKSTGWIVGEDQFKFIGKFDANLKDAFSLPRSYIYNRQGKLVKIVAQQNAENLGKFVQAALKK